MDELWQRYRTFWMPVLIGLGVFLLGIIAVHIITDDPAVEARRLKTETLRLRRLQVPNRSMSKLLLDKSQRMRGNVEKWAPLLDQTGTGGKDLVSIAATQALRAAFLRGAADDEAAQAESLAERFDGDIGAAIRARQKFAAATQNHAELLTGGDPNVAFSRLLSETWTELRIRANRADMEIVDSLGFGTVSSVNRATLPGRVLNLALVAQVVDIAIRTGMQSMKQIRIESLLRPGTTKDFVVSWPVGFQMVGPFSSIQHVLDFVTDPKNPTPLVDNAVIQQPRSRDGSASSGIAQMDISLASTVVRADVDLGFESQEENE